MLLFWLVHDDKSPEMKEIRKKNGKILKVVAHTIFAKSLLYGSAAAFSLIFLLVLICSSIACAFIHSIWFICRIDVADLKLSTEVCDSLEWELVLHDMKRAKDVKSDWVEVRVKTSSEMECTMRLHSLICISNEGASNLECDKAESCSAYIHSKDDENSMNVSDAGSISSSENDHKKKSRRTDSRRKKSTSKPEKPVLFWLHGAGGTAMLSFGISGIIDRLADDYDIYALDLPGFGRSTIDWPNKNSLRDATVEDICELFAKAFLQFLKIKKLKKVYLVGHSFGAYHAINFAEKYPEVVRKLLVVDPGGMFPIQCKEGAFMAIIFKWGVPMYYFRSLGSPGFLLYQTFLTVRAHFYPSGSWGKKSARVLSYWYQVQAAQDGAADVIIGKFFEVGYFTANGASPAYKRFLNLKMPVAIGYGERDLITPPHQGLILSGLCGSTVPVYMISKAGHLPMRKQDGQDFVTLINDAYINARPIKENASDFLSSLPATKSGGMFGTDLRSYFSTECTLNNMIKFYDFILSERRNSLSPLQHCLECPNVVNIDGDKISATGHHFQISDKAIQSTINKHFVQSEKSLDMASHLDKNK